MLAPRHPERFAEVASLLQSSGLSWARRTSAPDGGDVDAAAILLDTIGELPSTFALASVVFVGGSIVDRGGHNVLEPAAASVPVVTGSHTHNFHAIVDLLNEAGAIIQLPPLDPTRASACLTHTLDELLKHKEQCLLLGQRAQQVVAANKGTTDRTIALIKDLFTPPEASANRVYSDSASLKS